MQSVSVNFLQFYFYFLLTFLITLSKISFFYFILNTFQKSHSYFPTIYICLSHFIFSWQRYQNTHLFLKIIFHKINTTHVKQKSALLIT